jgi:hypothetical protein
LKNKKEKESRQKNKNRALEYLGNECKMCGYKKCMEALEFHHCNGEKNFNISQNLHLPWRILKKELNKCILTCKNCHCEIENGIIEL